MSGAIDALRAARDGVRRRHYLHLSGGWIFGHSAVIRPDPAERAWAREELDWWVPRVRAALERTGAIA